MEVGLIRCQQTEDMCPATTDFKVMKERKLAFEGIEGQLPTTKQPVQQSLIKL
ncbi:CGGC domain-containing protein [Methanohalobium sp.]|uniref:CGGC domain-containing protein n=1 Tax=Methanohalobium sp. TaxID=2837493 RepID=UPI0025E7BB84|nr:CGGC domain-containing protein [Methanohalobium sp.]